MEVRSQSGSGSINLLPSGKKEIVCQELSIRGSKDRNQFGLIKNQFDMNAGNLYSPTDSNKNSVDPAYEILNKK